MAATSPAACSHALPPPKFAAATGHLPSAPHEGPLALGPDDEPDAGHPRLSLGSTVVSAAKARSPRSLEQLAHLPSLEGVGDSSFQCMSEPLPGMRPPEAMPPHRTPPATSALRRLSSVPLLEPSPKLLSPFAAARLQRRAPSELQHPSISPVSRQRGLLSLDATDSAPQMLTPPDPGNSSGRPSAMRLTMPRLASDEIYPEESITGALLCIAVQRLPGLIISAERIEKSYEALSIEYGTPLHVLPTLNMCMARCTIRWLLWNVLALHVLLVYKVLYVCSRRKPRQCPDIRSMYDLLACFAQDCSL